MSIACKLQDYLDRKGVEYELVRPSVGIRRRPPAASGAIPDGLIAKSVLLEDDYGYVMAVVPATHQVEPRLLRRLLNRDLAVVPEQELGSLFDDCEAGAIPPVGEAYGLQVLVEESLAELPDVYFEAGDHTDMVHMRGPAFRAMMARAEHGHISRGVLKLREPGT